jgi:hypothetical protein
VSLRKNRTKFAEFVSLDQCEYALVAGVLAGQRAMAQPGPGCLVSSRAWLTGTARRMLFWIGIDITLTTESYLLITFWNVG